MLHKIKFVKTAKAYSTLLLTWSILYITYMIEKLEKRINRKTILGISVLAIVLLINASCKNTGEKEQGHTDSPLMKTEENILIYPQVGDLNTVKGLTESKFFDLEINGEDVFVYHSAEIRDPHEHRKQGNSVSYTGVSYANFVIKSGIAELEVSALQDATEWRVQPDVSTMDASLPNKLVLSLDKPQKFVITANIQGKEHGFIISAEPPEKNIPVKGTEGVLYLEPGVHKYGQAWDPYTNGVHTVYIAGGAVVEATIKSKDKKGVKLLGRGILSQSFVTHAEESREGAQEQEWDSDWLGVVFMDSQDIEINGIAVMSSPSYQMELANCKKVTIDNLKLCGFGEHNNDGIHTYSSDVLVENSLIASNDDRICITGLYDKDNGAEGLDWDGTNELTGVPVSNITIRNMVFWGLDGNGGDIMLTWNGAGYAKNIIIEDVVSLTPTNKAFIAARHGGSADIHDMTIKNVRLQHGNLFDIEIAPSNYQGAGGGKIRNLYLENIDIKANFQAIGKQLKGQGPNSAIDGITLKNINTSEGRLETIEQLGLETNEFVRNVRVAD